MSNTSSTLALDVYGTLIDTHGIIVELEKHISASALEFSQTWRNKQLEYSFRRGLMGQYKDFFACTVDAFEYTCKYFDIVLTATQTKGILDTYSVLPAFSDVKQGLEQVRQAGLTLYAFSNGTAQAVDTLLVHAGIREYFVDIVSVDEVKSFKPDPAVYEHFLKRANALAGNTWLVSSNPFDVVGAISAGLKGVWVQRHPRNVFDPWDIEPTVTITGLDELLSSVTT